MRIYRSMNLFERVASVDAHPSIKIARQELNRIQAQQNTFNKEIYEQIVRNFEFYIDHERPYIFSFPVLKPMFTASEAAPDTIQSLKQYMRIQHKIDQIVKPHFSTKG